MDGIGTGIDIVIDPGHGDEQAEGHSTPHGVRGPAGTLEKDVTLHVAQRLAEALGPTARLTRTDDSNLSLAARAEVARRAGARAFLSLHANSGGPADRGAEAWVHERGGDASRSLASRLLAALASLPDSPPSRGVRIGEMAVLTPESLAPGTSACLLEVDFLSDAAGERRLCDENAVGGIAAALASALRDHVRMQSMPAPAPVPVPALPLGLDSRPPAPASGRWAPPPRRDRPSVARRYGTGAGGRKRALLVGINDYTLATPSGANNLGGCVNDASAMSRQLQRAPLQFAAADVTMLTDQAATKSGIISALRGLMAASEAGDVLCFYYSGHGTYVADSGVPGRFAQALFCADGQTLLDRELASLTSSLADGVNFTIILDSCFSGGMGEAAGVPDTLRGLPLPAEMQSDGTPVTLLPVGLCVNPGTDPAISGTISNARFVCEPRPNTTAVPYARSTLFTAVDFCELAGERNGRGDYTTAPRARAAWRTTTRTRCCARRAAASTRASCSRSRPARWACRSRRRGGRSRVRRRRAHPGRRSPPSRRRRRAWLATATRPAPTATAIRTARTSCTTTEAERQRAERVGQRGRGRTRDR